MWHLYEVQQVTLAPHTHTHAHTHTHICIPIGWHCLKMRSALMAITDRNYVSIRLNCSTKYILWETWWLARLCLEAVFVLDEWWWFINGSRVRRWSGWIWGSQRVHLTSGFASRVQSVVWFWQNHKHVPLSVRWHLLCVSGRGCVAHWPEGWRFDPSFHSPPILRDKVSLGKMNPKLPLTAVPAVFE